MLLTDTCEKQIFVQNTIYICFEQRKCIPNSILKRICTNQNSLIFYFEYLNLIYRNWYRYSQMDILDEI